MSDTTVEIYCSARRPKSDERRFVLAGAGIGNEAQKPGRNNGYNAYKNGDVCLQMRVSGTVRTRALG